MVVATPSPEGEATTMNTTGPFHSLTEANKQDLIEALQHSHSVLAAANDLNLHYRRASNFAHRIKRVDRQ